MPGLSFLDLKPLGTGVFPATLLATPAGWRPAGLLHPGDWLLSPGPGALRLALAEKAPAPLWAIHLPRGACGGHGPLCLPPGQALRLGTEGALLPAQALEGWRGIEGRPNSEAPLILRLDRPGLILAGPGLVLAMPGPGAAPAVLDLAEARARVARWAARDLGRALRSQAAARDPGPG